MISNKNTAGVHRGHFFSWEMLWYLANGTRYGATSTAWLNLISRSKRLLTIVIIINGDKD